MAHPIAGSGSAAASGSAATSGSGSHLPKSRLNQIAQRKLASLGLSTTLSADQELLEGELPLVEMQIVNPFTKAPIDSARFIAVGHDHMRFTFPPALQALPPIHFYDLPSSAALVGAVEGAVLRRHESLTELSARMRRLGFKVELDETRGMIAKVQLHATIGTAVIEGDGRGLFVTTLIPTPSASETPKPIDLGRVPVLFAALSDRVDFELFLANLVGEARARSPAPGRSGDSSGYVGDTGSIELLLATEDLKAVTDEARSMVRSKAREIRPTPSPPPSSLTLGLLVEKAGENALVGSGVSLVRELTVRGELVQFEAKHVEGITFLGSVRTQKKGIVWSERFVLDGFPGVERFIQTLLQVETEPPLAPPPAPPLALAPAPAPAPALRHAPSKSSALAKSSTPSVGEIWWMRVLIEAETEDEVRYVNVNAKGQPYGAPRVLKKSHFHDAFDTFEDGHRLFVQIVSKSAESVSYVRQGREGKSEGSTKAMPLLSFIAAFLPE